MNIGPSPGMMGQMSGPPHMQGPPQMPGPPLQGPPLQGPPPMQGQVGSMQGPPQVQQEKLDNISKVKSLTIQLRESLAKTAIECHQQGTSSQRYLNVGVATTRTEPLPNQEANTLTYPQYLNTTKNQVAYAKDIHDMLTKVAHNINPQEPSG
ncbi:hypothetical protein WDU94_001838 [Cyamophila willieti]